VRDAADPTRAVVSPIAARRIELGRRRILS
jgi:hypothetical protein